MASQEWVKEFPGAITVCDSKGIILEMNDRAEKTFAADGGRKLIGSNVLDCHPEPARTQLQTLLETGRANVYTIEKQGKKKLIYQTPWYAEGQYAGLIELALELPDALPHFVRGA